MEKLSQAKWDSGHRGRAEITEIKWLTTV